MKIISINYKKIFPGEIQFTNTTLGLEIAINDGESPEAAFDLAKKTVDNWHNGISKVIHTQVGTFVLPPTELPVKNLADEKIEIAIDNATTKEQLSKLMPTLPVHLKDMYEKKLNELSV